jgi:tape measure domain-containing protein
MSSGIQIPIGGDLAPFLTAVNQLRNEVTSMSRDVTERMKPISHSAQAAGKDFRVLGQEAVRSGGLIQQALGQQGASALNNAGFGIAGMGAMRAAIAAGMGGAVAAIMPAAVAFAALGATAKISLAVLRGYAEFDGLVRGLKTLDGTAEATEARLKVLRNVAQLPGLGFEEAVRGDIRLRAAGISAKTSEGALRAFGNALATVGGGKDQLDGVIMALAQISAKGKVSAEEINQLAERVPQIRAAMKDAFGTADTEKLGKQGLTSEKFIEGIVAQLAKLPAVSGGAQNAVENFEDAWKSLKTEMTEMIVPLASGVVSEFSHQLNFLRSEVEKAQQALGLKKPGLSGKDGQSEAERQAQAASDKKSSAEIETNNAGVRVHNENVAYWNDLKAQQIANDRTIAAKKLETEEANQAKLLALKEDYYAIVLDKEKNLRRQIANMESEGFLGAAAMAGANTERQVQIGARTNAFLSLRKELAELLAAASKKKDPDVYSSLPPPMVLTTALGRIGGGGFGMTFMPMLGEQKIANRHLDICSKMLTRIEGKTQAVRAIV